MLDLQVTIPPQKLHDPCFTPDPLVPQVCPLKVSLSMSPPRLQGRCSAADPLLWPPTRGANRRKEWAVFTFHSACWLSGIASRDT